jgi:hypothetical protein
MTEQPIPMLIADPEMIDALSMTQIILKAAAWKNERRDSCIRVSKWSSVCPDEI